MGKYTIISQIFASEDYYDYGVCDNKDKIDFTVRVIISKKILLFYKDQLLEHYFYKIDMNEPDYEEKPSDKDLDRSGVPRGAFAMSAYKLKKALKEGIFPKDLSKFS